MLRFASSRLRSCCQPAMAFVLGLLTFPVLAAAEQPFELDLPLLFDTSDNPTASPENPRAHGLEIFFWDDQQHLIFNTGNDLQLSNIAEPHNPTNTSVSDFGVPPLGDVDYNLRGFSVLAAFLVLTRPS